MKCNNVVQSINVNISLIYMFVARINVCSSVHENEI